MKHRSPETDPVCGAVVTSSDAPLRAYFRGRIYCFCSASCQKEFERDPTLFYVLMAEEYEEVL